MKNRTIRLSEYSLCDVPKNDRYRAESIAKGFNALLAADLRFSNRSGIMRDNRGELERYSDPSDFAPYSDMTELMEWHFSRYIFNAASRIERGFPAH
jgi:hypothetical protein